MIAARMGMDGVFYRGITGFLPMGVSRRIMRADGQPGG